MRQHLTDRFVMNVKPPKIGQDDYHDTGFRGLALRISPGGTKTWMLVYRHGGKRVRLTLGHYPKMTLKEAREAWRAGRIAIQAGRHPVAPPAQGSDAFLTVVELWLTRDQGGNRTAKEAQRIMYKYCTPLHGMRVGEITRRHVSEVLATIEAPVMARKVHVKLHRFLNWCVQSDWLEHNVMEGLPRAGREVRRDRVLSDDELVQVWKACEAWGWPWGPLIQLLILTGARRGEITGLRWDELTDYGVHLPRARTKGDIEHDIPLSKTARAIVSNLPRIDDSPFVFTTNGKAPLVDWSGAKRELNKRVPLEPWIIHDLRRTCATGLQRLGVALQVTEAILGHTSGSRAGIVGIYQRHHYRDEKREALERWGEYVRARL
jgi:integrase